MLSAARTKARSQASRKSSRVYGDWKGGEGEEGLEAGEEMKHRLWFNEVQGFAYMQLVGEISREDILTLFSRIDEVFAGKDSHNIIIDLRLSPGTIPSKELRDLFKRRANEIRLDRVAILGAGPTSRMTFRILVSVLGKTEITRFCDTEQQTLAWMRGEN